MTYAVSMEQRVRGEVHGDAAGSKLNLYTTLQRASVPGLFRRKKNKKRGKKKLD